MILLTRLTGPAIALNPDLMERVEANPDTVITLVDGKKVLVHESLETVVAKVAEYRAEVLRRSYIGDAGQSYAPAPPLRLISDEAPVPSPRPGHRPPRTSEDR